MAVKPDLMPDRWMRPLCAIHSFADRTSDADRIKLAAL